LTVRAAVQKLSAAAEEKPQDPAVLLALAQASLIALDLESADRALADARRLKPSDPAIEATYAIATALRADISGESHHMEAALATLNAALAAVPADPVLQFNRAVVLSRLGRNAEAAEQFRRLLSNELDPAWRDEINQRLQAASL
jgi:predicted Zn-dependent protease